MPKSMLSVRIKASNKSFYLSREVKKIDDFIGQIFSFLFFLYLLFEYVNKIMNDFNLRKNLIYALFKNHNINSSMMKKFKVYLEKYNETEYKDVPDFLESKSFITKLMWRK